MIQRAVAAGHLSFLVGLAALCAAASAHADTPFMQLGRAVPPPRGFIDFCAREPAECPQAVRPHALAANTARPEAAVSEYWRLVFQSMEPAALPRKGAGERMAASDRGLVGDDEPAATALADEAPEAPILLTASVMAELNEVNRSINAAITPASDSQVYGRSDYWALPLEEGPAHKGDCEDYVLEKRRVLREHGYPENALSIALVETPWRQTHAVLLVRTDRGEMVLDSLSSKVTPWRKAHFAWIARQSPLDPAVWVAGPGAH